MEEATRTHFFKHGKPESADDRSNCHWCQLRSFPSHRQFPVTVVNVEDDAVLPPDFRFTDRMVLGSGVEAAEDSFRSGCACDSHSHCQYFGCQCLAELEEEEDDDDDDDDEFDEFEEFRQFVRGNDEKFLGGGVTRRATGKVNGNGNGNGNSNGHGRRKAYAYHTHGAKAGLLRSKMLGSKRPLYECHAACSCSKSCPNRVVERGRTIPLQIFRTTNRGWGVRSQVAIQKGQFVDRYVGEIITSAEADSRRAASAISKLKDVYLFALDKFTSPDSLDPRLKGPPLEVDGEFLSGPTRFINHSCEPNLRIFARVGDHADKHIHDLALFAIRDIPRGEELTFDYVDGVTEDGAEQDANTADRTKCLCGSRKCRGYLW